MALSASTSTGPIAAEQLLLVKWGKRDVWRHGNGGGRDHSRVDAVALQPRANDLRMIYCAAQTMRARVSNFLGTARVAKRAIVGTVLRLLARTR
jgi:hypothetical protein